MGRTEFFRRHSELVIGLRVFKKKLGGRKTRVLWKLQCLHAISAIAAEVCICELTQLSPVAAKAMRSIAQPVKRNRQLIRYLCLIVTLSMERGHARER